MPVINITAVNLDHLLRGERLSERASNLLSISETERAAAMVNSLDQARYKLAHIALRELLATAGDTIRPKQEFEHSKNGKPFLRNGPWFSLSRSDQLALIAISTNGPVGIDIERIRRVELIRNWQERFPMLKRLSPGSAPDNPVNFLRAWTRLEAIAKRDDEPLVRILGQTEPHEISGHVEDLDVHSGYLAAVAGGEDYVTSIDSWL